MLGRLFQSLQQSVAGFRCQHVGFVDDIDLVPAVHRREVRVFIQIFNVVHAPVGSSVQLLHIHRAAVCNLPAVQAFPAGMVRRPVFTIQGFGKNTGRSGFPRAPGSRKQICMGNTAAGKGVHQSLLHRSLSNQRFKTGRPPAQIQSLVSHIAHPFRIR